jgi:membrane-bound lytic murein transglycosylase A
LARAGAIVRIGAACLIVLAAAACATSRPGRAGRQVTRVADLPGWAGEDHVAAFNAYREGCIVARDPSVAAACRRALEFEPRTDADARAFFESTFQVRPVGEEGLLTAYYTPVFEARTAPDATFSAPVRPAPKGMATVIPSRAEIDALDAPDALAWMKLEELFFMQIQGSGVLRFPDGRTVRAMTALTNGLPFVGIARIMRDRGLLGDNATSGDAILAWLAAHRGPEADEIMRQNPRYGFFELTGLGPGVKGAAGRVLTPRRAIAVDPKAHPYGGLYWIDADAPALKDAAPVYRGAAMALDTGGAIKGEARADLYLGAGDEAGREAGRVRHRLRLYELVPVS